MKDMWVGYNAGYTMGMLLGHSAWQIDRPSNGSMWNSYSFQPVGPWMGYSFTDVRAEGCCRSLNALFYSCKPRTDLYRIDYIIAKGALVPQAARESGIVATTLISRHNKILLPEMWMTWMMKCKFLHTANFRHQYDWKFVWHIKQYMLAKQCSTKQVEPIVLRPS